MVKEKPTTLSFGFPAMVNGVLLGTCDADQMAVPSGGEVIKESRKVG